MFDASLLPDGGLGWLDASGDQSDVVLSTRIRLARNVDGYAFPGRAREGERLRVWAQVRDALPSVEALSGGVMIRVDELAGADRQLLHERHVISRELAGFEGASGVRAGAAVCVGDAVGVMINEEDHLRLQSLRSGLALERALSAIMQLDDELGRRVPFSFHRDFGFLTACPTNTGTGMRASVLIHLPGLVLTKEISRVLAGLQQMGLTYRGLYGEGSEVLGSFFQVSNQTTLGRSEEELVDHLGKVVRHVIQREHEARRVLWRDAGYIIEDKLFRAYGTLRYARSLSFEDAMNLLSGVRLAVGMQLVSGLSVYTLNKLLIFSQPAHLAWREGRELADAEADIVRARFVREALADEVGPAV